MISFESDYNNGAHPLVLQRLVDTNSKQSRTYGFDEWSNSAREKIRKETRCPMADVYFLTGGTQTNMTVINGCLKGYEAVIGVESGHINIHEAGAIEFTGHKVIALPSHQGKMRARELAEYMDWFVHDESTEHLAQPGMVYITFPTELGTLYTSKEIEQIYAVCQEYGLLLFVDGARLGYGLMSYESDISLPWLAKHCDVFYIGGTKVGALCGEAVVFPHGNAPKHFFTIIKRQGALSAKGRTIGVQFDALFTDHLYFDISRHAIDMAVKLRQLLVRHGFQLWLESPTNQQFFIIDNKRVKELEQKVEFTHWEPYGEDAMVCRFVASWATTDEDLATLERLLCE